MKNSCGMMIPLQLLTDVMDSTKTSKWCEVEVATIYMAQNQDVTLARPSSCIACPRRCGRRPKSDLCFFVGWTHGIGLLLPGKIAWLSWLVGCLLCFALLCFALLCFALLCIAWSVGRSVSLLSWSQVLNAVDGRNPAPTLKLKVVFMISPTIPTPLENGIAG